MTRYGRLGFDETETRRIAQLPTSTGLNPTDIDTIVQHAVTLCAVDVDRWDNTIVTLHGDWTARLPAADEDAMIEWIDANDLYWARSIDVHSGTGNVVGADFILTGDDSEPLITPDGQSLATGYRVLLGLTPLPPAILARVEPPAIDDQIGTDLP